MDERPEPFAEIGAVQRPGRAFDDAYARKQAPLLAWYTKLLLVLMVIGAGGFIAYRYFQKSIGLYFNDLTGANAATSTSADATSPAISTTDAYRTNPKLLMTNETQGSIGDQLLVDDSIVSVVDVRQVPVNDKGVSLYIVSALIGNGGRKPIKSPLVATALYDADDRQYDAADQEGRYAPGISLNPLLCLDKRFAFIVPDSVIFSRVEFQLPNQKIVSIDLTKKSAAGQTALDMDEYKRLIAAADAFSVRVAARQHGDSPVTTPDGTLAAQLNPQYTALEEKIQKMQDQNVDAQQRLASLAQKKDTAEKDSDRLEKRAGHLKQALSDAQDKRDRETQNVKDAQDALNAANAALNNTRFSHDATSARLAVSRAEQNFERQKQHAADAQTNLVDRQEALVKTQADLLNAKQIIVGAGAEISRVEKEMEQIQKTIGDNQKQLAKMKK